MKSHFSQFPFQLLPTQPASAATPHADSSKGNYKWSELQAAPLGSLTTPRPRQSANKNTPLIFLFASLMGALNTAAVGGGIELVMPPVDISAQGDASVFSTPIDVQDGQVVVAHVTAADANTTSGYLNTVIRKGKKVGSTWQWESKTLSNTTLLDPYHTQPSVAFDRNGFIHVAYNMHNLPWQYVISEQPYAIHNFVFYGQAVSKLELDALRLENKTHYPSQGRTLIPGNQITYPAFFKDRAGELFISYRYAMRPALNWNERSRAAGIARFDTNTLTWLAVGGVENLSNGDFVHPGASDFTSTAFAYDAGYEPYLVTLAFDADNAMHAIWTWRDKASTLTGSANVFPTYSKVANTTLPTPVASTASGRIPGWSPTTVFGTPKSIAIAANGDVLAILEPQGVNRKLIRRDHATGNWSSPADTPFSASKVMVDRDGNEWVFASGLNLFKRIPGGAWSLPIKVGVGYCDPRPIYSESENSFYIHAKTCSGRDKAVVYRYQLD